MNCHVCGRPIKRAPRGSATGSSPRPYLHTDNPFANEPDHHLVWPDGEPVTRKAQQSWERHLATCPQCRSGDMGDNQTHV